MKMKLNYITRKVKNNLIRYANRLPAPLWMEVDGFAWMLGEDVNLTPLGENNPGKFIKGEMYKVSTPKHVPMDHYVELRKEYKAGGFAACELYVCKIMIFTNVVETESEREILVDIIKRHNGGEVPKKFSRDGVFGLLVKEQRMKAMYHVELEEGEEPPTPSLILKPF